MNGELFHNFFSFLQHLLPNRGVAFPEKETYLEKKKHQLLHLANQLVWITFIVEKIDNVYKLYVANIQL
jgi:hypothetical protein